MAACNTFNVIYMIQCDLCNLQYIVETKRRLKDALYIDALYLTPPVVTFKPQFQNSFSAIAAVSYMLLIPIETLRYERDVLGKHR